MTSHSCSEESLEDAANVLLQLSRGDPVTRDTVLKVLLNGARHLGYTFYKQIGKRGRRPKTCLREKAAVLSSLLFPPHPLVLTLSSDTASPSRAFKGATLGSQRISCLKLKFAE